MSEFVVAAIAPNLLNIHGDSQNAQVLAVRAEASGKTAGVVDINEASDAAGLAPDAVVIGSGFDADASEVLELLRALEPQLNDWVLRGVPLLAVGLGWELLSCSTQLSVAETLTGIGIFSGKFVLAPRRVGPLVCSSRWGNIVGYGYHPRDYVLGADEAAFGEVLAGSGNQAHGEAATQSGAIRGRCWGTAMRGPILARNPQLADTMLQQTAPSEMRNADEMAAFANTRVLHELGIA